MEKKVSENNISKSTLSDKKSYEINSTSSIEIVYQNNPSRTSGKIMN